MYHKEKITNLCPHDVSIYGGTVYDPSTGKSIGGKEILRFPTSGKIALAQSAIEPLPPMELDNVEVPLCKRSFQRVSELPENDGYFIVSSVFAQAARDLGKNISHLLTPYGSVVDAFGRVVGCTGLICYDNVT